ncbi:MAG: DEAD/DEAH box helicase [Bacteroidetes bacterium]|nr:MAG: DEAD/DEAH box helicase [Bacteroidota bacterium]
MRLVDPNIPFQVVYAVYHHQFLGYLISAHYVQLLPNGSLSLVHQGAYPEVMDQFDSGLDARDRELLQLTGEILPREIIKKYGGNPRAEADFFLSRFTEEISKLAQSYIQRRMARILPLLADRQVFEMGNDSYPAQRRLQVLEEKGTVLFHFRRREQDTQYFPTIKLRGEKINFQNKGAVLLCLEPAWMLLDGEIFTFEQAVEGLKLKPFLKRYNITIPKEKEAMYYERFITQIVERYHVFAKGFEIHTLRQRPTFALMVRDKDGRSFAFERQVRYGSYVLPLDDPTPVKAILNKQGNDFSFTRIERDLKEEQRILDILEPLTPNPNSLTTWGFVAKDEGLDWLSRHSPTLEREGIAIVQENPQYDLRRPELIMSTEESGDWFDIKAIVRIGKFEIPFLKFRTHILKHKREYTLPDGTVAILPEHWFSDYRHLMEVSEKRQDDTLSIRKYQAPLLHFPTHPNGQNGWVEALRKTDRIPEVAPPKGLQATLRNYQQEGFNWLCFMQQHGMGAILADDMGLGKTLQTLTLLLKELESGVETPSLVVLPTSLIHNWREEAQRFTPKLRVHVHVGINRLRDPRMFSPYHLILTTYGIVRQDLDMLRTFPFHYVILDESQMIKNPESKTARAVRQLVSRHRLSLTGTPIENTVMDIWSQMAFLNPGLLGNETFFKNFYVTPIEKEKDNNRSAKLRRIIYPFILRRKKHQVERELPPKVEHLHYCAMTDAQERLYEETRNTYRNYLMELITQGAWQKNKLNILTGLQKLRQIAIHPRMVEPEQYALDQSGKYKEVKRLLSQVIERKRSKVLIFSQFVKMLHLLRDDLEAEGIPFTYLDGSTKDRQEQVHRFQEDKKIRVFLISLKAGGVGLNLTAADYVFILDPWWNPAVENQAIDRSHRIGQKRTVFYYKFISEGTIEEKILNLQHRKAQLSDDIITVEEDIYKTLDAVDLEELLK